MSGHNHALLGMGNECAGHARTLVSTAHIEHSPSSLLFCASKNAGSVRLGAVPQRTWNAPRNLLWLAQGVISNAARTRRIRSESASVAVVRVSLDDIPSCDVDCIILFSSGPLVLATLWGMSSPLAIAKLEGSFACHIWITTPIVKE